MATEMKKLEEMKEAIEGLTSKINELLSVTDIEKKISEKLKEIEEERDKEEAKRLQEYWENMRNTFNEYFKRLAEMREEKKRSKSTTTGKSRPTRVIYERPQPMLRVIEEHYELLKQACTYILHNIIGIQSIMPASETAIDVYRLCLGTRHLANALRDLLDIIAYERLKVVPETEIVEAGE